MTTATASPSGFRQMSVFSAGGARLKATEINDDGTASYKRVPIFRSGTFKDSIGIQHTYEHEHMAQAVFNYDLLKERGILTPPVRVDHSLSVQNVAGYFDALTAEKGDAHTFLLADFTITEPPIVEKIERGTFRFRSAEVGYYETNDEALYWPVVVGFAFVDMPAVEGLDAYAADQTTTHFSMHVPGVPDKEQTMDTPKFTITRDGQKVETSDYAAIQAMLDAAANPPEPVKAKFRIGGSETDDAAKVQSHIDSLETFRTETVKLGKESFIDSLVKDNKILATQADDFKAHVAPLDGPGFDAFKKLYEGGPANPLFANHGAGGDGGTPTPAGGEPTEQETLEEIVANHRRAGVSEEAIAKTDSFKRLQALKAAK